MATTTIYADRIQIIDRDHPTQAGTAASITGGSKSALMHFPFPSELRYKAITEIKLYLYSTPRDYYWYGASIRWLLGSFDSSVTYESAPEKSESGAYCAGDNETAQYNSCVLQFPPGNTFNFGILVGPSAMSDGSLSTSTSSHPPYIVVTYDDTTPTGTVTAQPTGGYISKSGAHTFRWQYTPPDNIVGEISVTGSDFNYKKASGDSYTRIDTGGALSYTTAAGLFSDTDTVIWYPAVTLSTGQRIYTQHAYTLSTVEPLFTATPVSPIGTLEDGGEEIIFSWTASNSAGTQPSGAEIQISSNGGTTWSALGSISGSDTTYTAAANTLPPGSLQWRVRAITSDGNAGSWSAGASFVCVSAPAAPSVSCDGAPFATITWEGTGQQAYEVAVDGVSYGVRFGTVKSFTLPQPLADGPHTASVRMQGIYGLWSRPGSVVFSVSNSAAGAVTLSCAAGADAELFWSASPAGADFLIYRDDVQIGHTALDSFTDRRALGTHSWYVLLRQSDGHYSKSNEITRTLTAKEQLICAYPDGEWIPFGLSEDSLGRQEFSYSREHTLRHFSGSPYPVLEISPYEDISGTLQCAFADAEKARRFEALRGKVVIVKTRETVLIGGLMNLSKARNTFYPAYKFTIEHIDTEEIIDDSDS